jgi:predicted transcriptional regulator
MPPRGGERPPEGRTEGARHGDGERRPEGGPESRERAEQREQLQKHVNNIHEELRNHANAIGELHKNLMEANRRLVELGGKPQPGFMGTNGAMVFGSFSMGTPNGGRPSGPMGGPPMGGPGMGQGGNPDTMRRLEQMERRMDEIMKRLEKMSRDSR